MICPHCNSQLPESLIVCFRCGKPLGILAEPASDPGLMPQSHAAGYIEPSYDAQSDLNQVTTPERRRKKVTGKVAAAVIAALILLSGGAVGGHFLGLYTLPLLPERSTAVDSADDPGLSAGEEEPIKIDDSDLPSGEQEMSEAAPATGELGADAADVIEIALSEGYSVRIQPTDDHSAIITLTDPQLRDSYPEFSDSLPESGLMYLWQIKIRPYDFDLSLLHFNYPDRSDAASADNYLETTQMQSGIFVNSRMLMGSIPVTVSEQSISWKLKIPEELAFDWTDVTEYEVTVERSEEDYWFQETFSADGTLMEESAASEQRLAEAPGEGFTGDMELQHSLPHLDIYTDRQNPRHASITLSGYPTPEWIFAEQAPTEESDVGFGWRVYLSEDGENLFSVYSDHWQGMGEGFNETNFGITSSLNYFYDDGYNGQISTEAHCVVTQVTADSITFDVTLSNEELFAWEKLNYLGFDAYEYNADFFYAAYSYVQLDGQWMELEGTSMPDYFRGLSAPQVWFEGVINGESNEEMLSIASTDVTVLADGTYQCTVTFANEMPWSVNLDILMDVVYDSGNYESNLILVEDAVMPEDSTLTQTFTLENDNPEEVCQVWFYYYHN